MHQDLIGAISIRSEPGYWILDTVKSYILVSSCQLSGILPKYKPFVTGGYWDDIAMAGIPRRNDQKLIVLGAGIGSFLPLLRTYHPDVPILCVERNEEIAKVGIKLRHKLGLADASNWIIGPVEELSGRDFKGASDVFIDLYLQEGINPLALDKNVHTTISKELPADGLVYINVYDQQFSRDKVSLTNYFAGVLAKYYQSGVIVRRRASSTLICGTALSQINLMTLVSRQLSLTHASAAEQIVGCCGFDGIELTQDHRLEDLVQFSNQVDKSGYISPNAGLAREAFELLSTISSRDFLLLSRRKSSEKNEVQL